MEYIGYIKLNTSCKNCDFKRLISLAWSAVTKLAGAKVTQGHHKHNFALNINTQLKR